jgi:hypothetical protein
MPRNPLPQFEARSGDAALLAAPLPSLLGAARIHSVFERVVNVETGRGRLLTLAFADADNAPDALVVNIRRWVGLGLAPGLAVRYAHGALALGGLLAISLAHATPWRCRFPAYPEDDDRMRTNLTQAQDILSQQGTGIGVGGKDTTRHRENDVDRVLRRIFGQACDGLYRALAAGDLMQAQPHAAQLIGLGPGLTPAGDDFLLGLLVALNIPESPAYALRALGDFVLACAVRQTHAISLAGLRQAAAGQARESIVGLCEALLLGDPTDIRPGLERVLQIGSSSGTDIALGLLTGFRLQLKAGGL